MLDHLGKRFQRRCFRNWPMRNKNYLRRPCLLIDRDEVSNLYKEPSIDASYQVSVHWTKCFQSRIFIRNRPIRNKNCLWWPWLLTNPDDMTIFIEYLPMILPIKCRIILESGFRGEDVLEINQSETRITCDGHVCLWIETKWAFAIENLPYIHPTKFGFIWLSGFRGEDFLEIDQSETRIACGCHLC